MGTISVTCAQCGRQLAVPDRYQGRELKCPGCGHPFRAELPHTEPAAAAASLPAAPPDPAVPLAFERSPFEVPAAPPPPQAEVVAAEASLPGESAPVYWRVRRIGVLSLALVSAALHAALGLIVALGVAVTWSTPLWTDLPIPHGTLLGVLIVIGLPFAYGAIGLAAGALSAAVYNLAARLTGGVSLLLE